MVDFSQLPIGREGRAELIVDDAHTAPRVGSGRVRVLATPVMINLMEAAALDAVEALLPAGHQSLGIKLDVSHHAATPVGMRIVATARLVGVEGRRLRFEVEARDEKETIGGGTHERVVVNVERFDERVQKKLGDVKP
ncbi:MAG: fluoroacetyl-CoA thioesterase [Alphaproteobacteria bacterium]|jgi:predicted thioesterase|nr:fluoroacetyl-CoA thioesterase [Alphaproteobacteria bacterium]